MARIRGYGFTRKDKTFAEFETNIGKFTFKESHTSKDSYYKVGIYDPSGKKVYSVGMTREQINKIKSGTGITNIEFTGEEGFKHFIENVYLKKNFNAENFHNFFEKHFSQSYAFISNSYYNIQGYEGYVDAHYNEYIAYLVSLAPENILENIYNNKRTAFSKAFNYNAYNQSLTESEKARNVGSVMLFLEKIEAETKQALGAKGIEYYSYDEFVSSGEYKKFQPRE